MRELRPHSGEAGGVSGPDGGFCPSSTALARKAEASRHPVEPLLPLLVFLLPPKWRLPGGEEHRLLGASAHRRRCEIGWRADERRTDFEEAEGRETGGAPHHPASAGCGWSTAASGGSRTPGQGQTAGAAPNFSAGRYLPAASAAARRDPAAAETDRGAVSVGL